MQSRISLLPPGIHRFHQIVIDQVWGNVSLNPVKQVSERGVPVLPSNVRKQIFQTVTDE